MSMLILQGVRAVKLLTIPCFVFDGLGEAANGEDEFAFRQRVGFLRRDEVARVCVAELCEEISRSHGAAKSGVERSAPRELGRKSAGWREDCARIFVKTCAMRVASKRLSMPEVEGAWKPCCSRPGGPSNFFEVL